jgi:hypothetical protein
MRAKHQIEEGLQAHPFGPRHERGFVSRSSIVGRRSSWSRFLFPHRRFPHLPGSMVFVLVVLTNLVSQMGSPLPCQLLFRKVCRRQLGDGWRRPGSRTPALRPHPGDPHGVCLGAPRSTTRLASVHEDLCHSDPVPKQDKICDHLYAARLPTRGTGMHYAGDGTEAATIDGGPTTEALTSSCY